MQNVCNLRYVSVLMSAAILLISGSGLPAFCAESTGRRYEIRYGDTLARIARRYYGDGKLYGLIAEANDISNPHRIITGRTLVIPVVDKAKKIVDEKPRSVRVEPEIRPAEPPSAPAFVWRSEKNQAYPEQESLKFGVKWKFITVGYATLDVRGVEPMDGRPAYHIVSEARSAPFFDNFYKVRDVNESWIDKESLVSLKFASHISEGGHKHDETIVFDHPGRRFRIEEKGTSGEIPLWVHDVLSALYFVRTKPLDNGTEYSVDAHSGDKSWPLSVKVIKRARAKVPAGEFDCVVVEPGIREGAGIFKADGKLEVWMTDDERKMPVLMRSKIPVGYIEAELIEYKR